MEVMTESDHAIRDCYGVDLTQIIIARITHRFERWEANRHHYLRMMDKRRPKALGKIDRILKRVERMDSAITSGADSA
jgi:hypothetical protein